MTPQLIFITGAMRSGTTLVDKILWQFDEVDSFSQPLPLLMADLKRAFLQREPNIKTLAAYPLSDMQFENYYDTERFSAFLNTYELGIDFLSSTLQSMSDYDGQLFKPHPALASLANWKDGTLADFIIHYLSAHKKKPGTGMHAFKEVFCEEYLSYFVENDAKVILVIRDPRGAINSQQYGHGPRFAGAARPILFAIRQLRKTYAFALKYQDHPNVSVVRYEDLVTNPGVEIEKIQDFLEIRMSGKPIEEDGLHDQSGSAWRSNSSFSDDNRIFSTSAEKFRQSLPKDITSFVEATCHCEMKAFGYQPDLPSAEVATMLSSHKLVDSGLRPELAGYRFDSVRRAEEIDRWNCVLSSTPRYSAEPFIFEAAYLALRDSLDINH